MKKKKGSRIMSMLVICVLSAANIAFAQSGVWNLGEGTSIDIAGLEASIYQIEAVSQLEDGYLVIGKSTGFQSDLEVSVQFDSTGNIIEEIKIISQGETDGIGSKVEDESFLAQFSQKEAPIGLNGKDIAIISPGTNEVWGVGNVFVEVKDDLEREIDPSKWNLEDQSPEAEAMRNLYSSGLLVSAKEGRDLEKPTADYGAEEMAAHKMKEAGLLQSGELEGEAAVVGGTVTEVDVVSGATISSRAVVQVVNHAYFFLQEKVVE